MKRIKIKMIIFTPIFILLLTLTTSQTHAALFCSKLFPPDFAIVDVFTSAATMSRADYLKTLSNFISAHQSEEVRDLGGRRNISVDVNGNLAKKFESEFSKIRPHYNLARMIDSLASYPKEFMNLLVDGGILHHADEFLKFLENCHDCKSKDPWQVRQMAAKALGTETFYRAIYLTEAQAERIKHEGLTGRIFENKRLDRDSALNILLGSRESNMGRHMSSTTASPYISLTKFPEVAIAVAKKFRENIQKGSAIYLFKVRIPKLDVLHRDEFDDPIVTERLKLFNDDSSFVVLGDRYFKNYKDTFEPQTEPAPPKQTIAALNTNFKVFYDTPDLESFVEFKIAPEEIVGVKRILRSPYRAETAE